MKHCIIFDMDGVIIDSEPIHQECERMIFRMLKINISEEEHNSLVGANDETMWSRFANKYDLPISVSEAIQLKKTLYMEYLKSESHIEPISYIPQLLAELYNKGLTLVVASSSPIEQIEYILTKFELRHFFQSIVSGEDVDNGKPHPEIFLKAADSVGVKPESCIVIEDSYNGVIAAKSANMKCVGFRNPNSGKQDLKKADLIVHSFKELSVKKINELLVG